MLIFHLTSLTIIIIENITIIVPINWYIVKFSPRNIIAKIAVIIGVGETRIEAFEISR